MLGPVFSIEIVTSLRRARYFAMRILYGCALLFALWIAYTGSTRGYSQTPNIRIVAEMAQAFFLTITTMQLVVVLLVGPAIVAGTIAQERQRRTIEYLFATDLSNLEIVLGKLAARLVHLFFIVLVGLPVVALARMLGGVPADLMLQTLVITLSTIMWVGSVSICVSVFAPKARDGVTRAYLVLFGMLVLPGLVLFFIELLNDFSINIDDRWFLIGQLYNPFVAFVFSASPGDATVALGAWGAVGILVVEQLFISVVCLLVAVRSVRRVHVKQASRLPVKDRPSLIAGRGRRPSLGNHPMLWKEMFLPTLRTRHPRLQRAASRLILVTAVGGTLWVFLRNMGQPDAYFWFAVTVGAIVACLGILSLAARAATAVTTEKEQETWQPLVSSPLEGRAIIGAKILGSLHSYRGHVFLLLVLWLPCAMHKPMSLAGIAFSFLALTAVGLFASAMGVLISLRSDSSMRALSWTLGTMVFLGGGYMFCCVPVLFLGSSGDEILMAMVLAPCSPFLIVSPMITAWLWEGGGSEESLFAAYLLGVIGYGIGAAVLYTTAVTRFDESVGRAIRKHQRTSSLWVNTPPPETPHGPSGAEVAQTDS